MDVRERRESRGIGLRELQRKTGISLATLSRIDSGEREASVGEATLIAAALDDGGQVPAPALSEGPTDRHKPRAGRRAYRCAKCNYRRFLHPNDPAKVVECPQHGPMPRQENRPYRGQAVPE